jgi:hypothetical protein
MARTFLPVVVALAPLALAQLQVEAPWCAVTKDGDRRAGTLVSRAI